ncbi:tetratricopeptide repeat protein [Saccharopolyspora sp. CA-218241]|uniref:tetratricopeptide repeat protein n=1 Tax=Saccharopolyspora sp. CA-218241 TaxID=3240027 RepID=UPI003D994D84
MDDVHGKAFAPEYQGSLNGLSVNTSYEDVLLAARQREGSALRSGRKLELAQAKLAVAEACRRLGRLDEAESAWRDSYRSAKDCAALAAMSWALWSGGTLARQRGRLDLALRWLGWARELGRRAGEHLPYGYASAGIAETLRIRGDHHEARDLHLDLLAEARERGECRHIVWALEGVAQLDRNTGDLSSAWERFAEAAQVASDGGDHRGHAWALRGQADVLSLRGRPETALELLSEAERTCREMDLASALAYNRKMRGNVLFRAGRYADAAETYQDAREQFDAIGEPRGTALASLGSIKCRNKLQPDRSRTERELRSLLRSLSGYGLRQTERMVEQAITELAEEPGPTAARTQTPDDTATGTRETALSGGFFG